MAIIQTIRDKYAKVAGGVIVLALVGFVLMDFGKSGFSGDTTAAKINGSKIDINDYFNKINSTTNQIVAQNPQANISDEQKEQIKDQVWNDMVADVLMEDVYDGLGIEVSENEVKDMFVGPIPSQLVQQYFVNPQTGQFDPAVAGERYNYFENASDPNEKANWAAFKSDLIKTRKEEKVGLIISCLGYTPTAILDIQNDLRHTTANMELVQLPYSMIADDKARVGKDEIIQYMKDRSAMFTNRVESRDIEYVAFSNVPSSADTVAMMTELDTLKVQFANATNAVEFAGLHSSANAGEIEVNKEAFATMDGIDDIMAANPGTVVGPILMGNTYNLVKVIEKSNVPDTVELKHIFIMENDPQGAAIRTADEAKAKIDSIAAAFKAGANFDSLAAQFSDDYQQLQQAGGKFVVPAIQKNQLPKVYADFAFSGAQGESKVIRLEEGVKGYYLSQIIKKGATKPTSKIVTIVKNFEPSEITKQEVSNRANTFATKAAAAADAFDKEAVSAGVFKKEAPGINLASSMINGLGVSTDLVAWAASANVGDVSPLIYVNNDIIVARLTAVNKKGELNQSKQTINFVERILVNKKKAAMLINEYKSKGDLAVISQASAQPIHNVDSFTYYFPNNPSLQGENKVLGYAFSPALAEGKVSEPIAGENGVYFIKVNKRTNNAASQARDMRMERQMSGAALKSNGYRLFLNSLLEKADYKDSRVKFITRGI